MFNIQYSASNPEGNRWVIGWLVINYIRYSMSNRWIINRSQNFQSSISHWLIIDIVSQIGKPYHIENLKKQTSLTKMSRYTLFIPDLLSGRHSMVAAFLDKDTDSKRQESKTDNSTFWIFCFWYFSYWCPINKFDLPFCFRHGKFNYHLARLLLSPRTTDVNFYHRK